MPAEEKERKTYIKPEVVEELDLETRAGTVIPNLQDPLDMP
jgi:hypothetical protein